MIPDGSVLIEDGVIRAVGPTRRIENLRQARNARLLDVRGKVVTPGLVDSRLRLSAGPAALRDFERRIAGLATQGRDGHSSPPASQAFDGDRARRWVRAAVRTGATTLEAHSGQGSSALAELRALRALPRAADGLAELSVGYADSFAAPGTDAEPKFERTVAVLERAAQRPRLSAFFQIDCGAGRFDWDAASKCAEVARGGGYRVKIEASGGRENEGVRFALEVGAASVEGLEEADDRDIEILAGCSAAATLLPLVSAHVGAGSHAPARRLLDRGAIVALASGFRPDILPGFGLPAAMAAACRELQMMPEEAIVGCTINAAFAIGRAGLIGSLEPDKQADLAVFDVGDYREIPFFFGVNLCSMTIKRGQVMHSSTARRHPPPRGYPWDAE